MESLNLTSRSVYLEVLQYKLQRFYCQVLGWQGAVGLLLIAASLIALFMVAIPREHQLQQLEMEEAAVKANPKQNVSINQEKSDLNQIFFAALPAQTAANGQINAILRMASEHSLGINKVEYNQPRTVTPLMQYQIKLPLTGSYLQIRQFITQALNALPSLALSGISLKREDLGTDTVDAQIQFTLYLQKKRQ